MMAHCPPSIVQSSVHPCVNNFFKQLLLLNHLAKFVVTLQGCSLHEALPKLLNELKFHEELWLPWQLKYFCLILKHLLVKNHKVFCFDIWYVKSSSGPLHRLFKLYPYHQKLHYIEL